MWQVCWPVDLPTSCDACLEILGASPPGPLKVCTDLTLPLANVLHYKLDLFSILLHINIKQICFSHPKEHITY